MSDELKPCAHCAKPGIEVERIRRGDFHEWSIECSGCGCRTDWYGSREAAVAAWNKRTDDTTEQPVESGEDVVAILRKYATFWGVSHATNTQCDSNWEVTTMRALADLIERDYVRRDSTAETNGITRETSVIGQTVDNAQADVRERLEADVREICWGHAFYRYDAQKRYLDERGLDVREDIVTTNYDGHVLATVIMHMLDRQAAITERECMTAAGLAATEAPALQAQVDSLTTERNEFADELKLDAIALDELRKQVDKLTAERDQLQEQHERQVKTIERLTAERDAARDYAAYKVAECERQQRVIDVQRDSFLKLERENRELQDVCGELERTLENMRGD